MIYSSEYIRDFREFARESFERAGPVDIEISGEGMKASLQNDETQTRLLADPPYFGIVDLCEKGELISSSPCATAEIYTTVIAEACKWAEGSPADRAVRGRVLRFDHSYRKS
jgi:hypothetical protein